MANGLQGISIQSEGVQIVSNRFGLQGISVEPIEAQYFYPQFGLVGIEINVNYVDIAKVIKTVKK